MAGLMARLSAMRPITAQAVARRFHMKLATVHRWIALGLLPGIKFQGVWVLDEKTLVGFERPKVGRPRNNA